MSNSYRLVRETRVVVAKDGVPEFLLIPENSVITIQGPPTEGTPLLPVKFGSITVAIFATDLERAQLVADDVS